ADRAMTGGAPGFLHPLIDEDVERGCDLGVGINEHDRLHPDVGEFHALSDEDRWLCNEEARQEGRSTQEGAGTEMTENVPPAVLTHNGMSSLGAAIEADHDGVAVPGDQGVYRQSFAFIAEIRAHDDGRATLSHDVTFWKSLG